MGHVTAAATTYGELPGFRSMHHVLLRQMLQVVGVGLGGEATSTIIGTPKAPHQEGGLEGGIGVGVDIRHSC